jgi:glutathione synthase|tara:strand:+ start:3018 stop:3941 length:924 start_codon:yes stop_codon:yes gene_type:complete
MKKYLFITDPINSLKIYKDTSVALIKACLQSNIEAHHSTINEFSINHDLSLDVSSHKILSCNKSIELSEKVLRQLSYFSKIFIRKDPPFDDNYLNLTHQLENAKNLNTEIINNPSSIRNHNEKLSILKFQDIIPPTIVTSKAFKIIDFLNQEEKIILKPLNGMAGNGIFMLNKNDKNINVILETMTINEQKQIMAQKYLQEIKDGDKRIILIKGKAIPYVLSRVPSSSDFRANLAKGGKGIVKKLSDNDKNIVERVNEYLVSKELNFVGLDIIGKFLTEINVTSPTGVVEISEQTEFDVAKHIIDVL